MRKKEYIYTHALLVEVTRYLIENDTISAEMLSAYDAIETRPASIHKSKQNHREAIMILSSAIASLTEEHTDNHK
jgi:hypothetical protein